MPCSTVKLPGGMAAIVCSRGRKKGNLCCACRAYATLQCDWPTPEGKTCDKSVCRSCARAAGPDLDYCPFHRGEPPLSEAEATAAGEAEADNAARILGVTRP